MVKIMNIYDRNKSTRRPCGLQLLNQKDEVPDPALQVYPFFRIFFARIMEDQDGELLG
jgi:hypothetical protein